jgi:molybdopterin synthase catalytic subunit
MNTIRVQTEDFDIGAECDALVRDSIDVGAIASFTGRVRGDDNLTALTIEHYPGMTEREIARHIADAEIRWPLFGVTIIHRVGRLVPGDRIVLVTVASAHRAAAFAAAEFIMDYLKTRAPFWKQEERGTEIIWVEAREGDADAARRWHMG